MPLYDALLAVASFSPLPLHIESFDEAIQYDLIELTCTENLFEHVLSLVQEP